MIRNSFLTALAAGVGLSPALLAEQVVISEIMYHPRPGMPEYLEIYNNTVTPFDIADWELEGGADYRFPGFSETEPQQAFLQPYERIVISSVDVGSARSAYGIPAAVRVFGPWSGNLSNDGERISLKDKNGVVVCTVAYGDGRRWPVAADGAGHSLVLRNPNQGIDDWRNWAASERPGGTPGFAAVGSPETPVPNPELTLAEGLVVTELGDRWRYWDVPDAVPADWAQPGFNDSSWPEGPGLLGFETATLPAPGIQTPLQDSDQITFYLRREFSYPGPVAGAVLTLDQVLDDGAVYYLNGQEIGRSRIGTGEVTPSRTASNVNNAVEEKNVFPVDPAHLREGVNVLAVEVHQSGSTSSDVVFGARLTVVAPAPPPSGLVLNEVLPGPAGKGFVEFYNTGSSGVDLQGFYLTHSLSDPTQHRIQLSRVVPPGGFGSVGYAETGLDGSSPVTLYLVASDGQTVESGLSAVIPPDGRSLGRKPAGSGNWFLFADATRDAPNQSEASVAETVRLNEVLFTVTNSSAGVELFNRGAAPVDLTGLRLASAPDFSDAVALGGEVPAGGRVLVNASFPVTDGSLALFLVNASERVLQAARVARPVGRDSMQAFPEGGLEWYATAQGTGGEANRPDRITDVVINEIMYDPPSDERDGEYVELLNRGLAAVDLGGWRFAEGPRFTFPAGTVIPAGGFLVLAANASHLRSVHPGVTVVGDYEGRLANRGECLRLVDAWGNLADEVDYQVGGDWPDLAQGNGSSLELIHPDLDNALPSAWADSNEAGKGPWRQFSWSGTYRQLRTMGTAADYKELHFHLAGDGYVVLQDIRLVRDGDWVNLIANSTQESTDGTSATGWLCQGTHWASRVTNGELHLQADGHGDNRANRAEIDVPGLNAGDNVTLSFNARWVAGTPRVIAQTWDHSVGDTFRLAIPENLGTPGRTNSRRQSTVPPQVDGLVHRPAVPRSTDAIRVTARVTSAGPLAAVELWHRRDNINRDGVWQSKAMADDGVTAGDALAGDGVYAAELTEYGVSGAIVEFYVRAVGVNGREARQPQEGPDRPALLVVDDRVVADDLRRVRMVLSAYDLGAISNGETPKYDYRFPRLSNHYHNATFIHDEEEVFYHAEIRNSGSPWTRSTTLERGKWKLPGDRRFRNHEKFMFDNDPTAGRMHNNRVARYLLYLVGHPASENEFVRMIINAGAPAIKEETEPVGNDLLDRLFEGGSDGELYRIDDEWWFDDAWNRGYRDADWIYKDDDRAIRYHTEWMRRSREDDYDYTALVNLTWTITRTPYTQEEIERLVDAEAMLQMAAVRGYIDDWDWITLNRGKNGYMYRRPSDGRFQFLHWDSDLAFRTATSALYTGKPGVNTWLSKPYNRRRFNHYLTLLVDHYTKGSARMNAWLLAEEDANNSFTVDRAKYLNWFNARESTCLNHLGSTRNRPLEVLTNGGQPLTTADPTVTLAGAAPSRISRIVVEGHPEARLWWDPARMDSWTLEGLVLRSGTNNLRLAGLDAEGQTVLVTEYIVHHTGPVAPQMDLAASPRSWHVGVEDAVALDARGSRDPDASALAFGWQAPSGLAWFNGGGDGVAVASFAVPGLYDFSVWATNAAGRAASLTREVAVYGPDGFSDFGGVALEPFWRLEGVEYRDNSPQRPWVSLAERAGQLTLQVPDGTVGLPLAPAGVPGPVRLMRDLPTSGDWVLETQVELASRQFGTFTVGLEVQVAGEAATNSYCLGLEGGTALRARVTAPSGVSTVLASWTWPEGDARLRMRRLGDTLRFEVRQAEVWSLVASQNLGAGNVALQGGLMVATGQPESVGVRVDYVMLVDPSNTSALRQDLRITEVMYHPVDGDAYEYVELTNVGDSVLELGGVRFVEGISYLFPSPTPLAAGGRIVVVSDRSAFLAKYPAAAGSLAEGVFTGRLDDGGERLTLVDALGNVIQSFRYDDEGDWPERPDGGGASLEVVEVRGDYEDPANWNSSREYLGSPGLAGIGAVASVLINEVLTHTDPPLEDAIELCNPTAASVDVGGWYLSDDSAELRKFRIPSGTTIPPGGTWVVYEAQLADPGAGAVVPFQLNSAHGDDVWLMAADGAGTLSRFIDHVDFGAAENGYSFGRYPHGSGPMVPLAQPTFGRSDPATVEEFRLGTGATNSEPRVGPAVFSQIYYDAVAGDVEYLEVLNITDQPLALYDREHATNTWRLGRGVAFVFPPGVELAVGGRLLVVPLAPAEYLATHAVPAGVQVFGPWVGALDNAGEAVELYKPDRPQTLPPDEGWVPQLLVERVRYDNHAPWPVLAAGAGAALLRRDAGAYGDDPANWYTDLDLDGMADDWEARYLLSPFYALDGVVDTDGDGWINREEYRYGSNPLDPSDVLHLTGMRRAGDESLFEFLALAAWSYEVWVAEDSPAGPWRVLHEEPAGTGSQWMTFHDHEIPTGSERFYKVIGRPPQ